jgi:tetratricopeptide (TPR) repeat protein
MTADDSEAKRLRQDVEWALRSALDPSDVLPLLHRLGRTAEPGSEESIYAHRQVAELLVERHPWRAALHARKVLSWIPEDDRAWAVLGLCQTLLGHYRFAATAYHRALTASPKNPWYAHNLGHLIDVALGRAGEATAFLRSAYEGASDNREIASSFAHALARAGKLAEAKKVLARSMKRGPSREQSALWKWLEEGAPADKDSAAPRPAPTSSCGVRTRRSPRPRVAAPELESALLRGLESIPLDARQRARARALARDPITRRMIDDGPDAKPEPKSVQSLAAAIAYAIVFIDDVPLTQGEVAASFRVSSASLRGRFSALRSQLQLAPGDARYRRRRRGR